MHEDGLAQGQHHPRAHQHGVPVEHALVARRPAEAAAARDVEALGAGRHAPHPRGDEQEEQDDADVRRELAAVQQRRAGECAVDDGIGARRVALQCRGFFVHGVLRVRWGRRDGCGG